MGRKKRQVQVTCQHCGKKFSIRRSEAKRRKYCSHKCSGKGRSEAVRRKKMALKRVQFPGLERLNLLTKRELQIMHMSGKGYLEREIAEKLGVTAKNVQSHRSNVRKRLRITQSRYRRLAFELAARLFAKKKSP